MPSPLDLALEVLTLQRGRYLCPDTIAVFNLPVAAPCFCSDWVTFLFQSVAPESLARIADLRGLLLANLEAHIHAHQAAEMASHHGLAWPQVIGGMRRMAYEHVAHGLLASPLEDGHPTVTFHETLTRMGRCMNLASHVRQYLDTPGPGYLGQCLALGESLCTLCMEHRQACRWACFGEGRGLVSRFVPPEMLCCEPRRGGFFGEEENGAPRIPTTILPTYDGETTTLLPTYDGETFLGGHATAMQREASLTEPPGPREAPPSPYLFKEGHFEPLVAHGQQHHHPQQQPQLPAPLAHPGGPIGEHATLPADSGVRPWTRRQRQRENEQPAPVFIRDEGEEGDGGTADPRVEPEQPHRRISWHVVGSIHGHVVGSLDVGPVDGAAVTRESPVAATISPWAPQGEWGGSGEAPGSNPPQVVGRRRRRGEEAHLAPPGYVAWGSGGPGA